MSGPTATGVPEEIAKTHPDKLVFGYAYQNAFLPPENIERLHPNLAVVMATVWRHRRLHPELNNPAKRDIDPIRRAWGKKVSSGVIYNWEYYLYPSLKDDGWHGTPVYFPHAIADDLRALSGIPGMHGEYVEVMRDCERCRPGPWDGLRRSRHPATIGSHPWSRGR